MSDDLIQELVQIDMEEAARLTYHALLLGDHETTFPSAELDQLKHM